MDIVQKRIALVGNINNPETLFAKEPEDVRAEVVKNLEAGVPLIGPECAIPLQTTIEKPPSNPRKPYKNGTGPRCKRQFRCSIFVPMLWSILELPNSPDTSLHST